MKKTILLLSLVLVVFFSGCVQPSAEGLPYKNDIITIEEYYVSDSTPYEGALVLVELVVKNNGEEDVPWMEIGFDASGFEIKSLSCEGGGSDISADEASCTFDKNHPLGEIESLDYGGERRAVLTMKVPDRPLLHPYTLSLSYSIEYNYSGFRKMDIPIIDGETLRRPLSEYSQSTPTYGPILLTFEPPYRGERVEDGQTIKEYWGVRDSSFNVEMKFTRVDTKSIGTIREPKVEAGMVKLDLRGSLEKAYFVEEGVKTFLPCDFYEKEGYFFSNDRPEKPPLKEIKVPGELMCNFQSTVFTEDYTEPETTATIWADFNYTYRYTNTQDFEVQPLLQQ